MRDKNEEFYRRVRPVTRLDIPVTRPDEPTIIKGKCEGKSVIKLDSSEIIGSGTEGVVKMVSCKCEDKFVENPIICDPKKQYSIKVVTDMGLLNIVKKEVSLAKKFMGDKHIMQILKFIIEEKKLIIVMEYAGFALDKIAREIPVSSVVNIFATQTREIIEVLKKRKIVHRDIKPSNICIYEPRFRFVLVDFGLAFDVETDLRQVQNAEKIEGSPLYMSPFHISPSSVTEKTCFLMDEWSMAVTMFELIFKHYPFKADVLSLLALRIHNHQVKAESEYSYLDVHFVKFFSTLRNEPSNFGQYEILVNKIQEKFRGPSLLKDLLSRHII